MPSIFTKFRRLVRQRNFPSDSGPNPPREPGATTSSSQVDSDDQPQAELPTACALDAVVKSPCMNDEPDLTNNPATTLESLPAELRRRILFSIPDLDDLRALVLASPVFFQQYLLDRKPLLGGALKEALGNILLDACAVQTSASLYDKNRELRRHTVKQFMNDFAELRSTGLDAVLSEGVDENDLVGMARFYRIVTRPLVSECAGCFLRTLDESIDVGNLSATEQKRLLRGLYRFQLYCNLFGPGPRGHRDSPEFDFAEILEVFFCVFRPWEIEEIGCIYHLVSEKYEQVFDVIQWDVHRDNPKFNDWNWPTTPPGAWVLDDKIRREAIRQGTAGRGLCLYQKCTRTNDHFALVEVMEKYMADAGVFEFVMSEATQYHRRHRYPRSEDRDEARGDKLPFVGDKDESPPLSWVIMWRGRYSNRYGDIVPKELKAWGYVFWDSKRLVKTKGKESLVRTCNSYGGVLLGPL